MMIRIFQLWLLDFLLGMAIIAAAFWIVSQVTR